MATIYIRLGQEELAAAAQLRHADQKAIKRKMSKLADGSFLARVIGDCKILNSYSKASLGGGGFQ